MTRKMTIAILLGDRVLIRPSKTGPENVGEVVDIGLGLLGEPLRYKTGDRVLHSEYGGTETEVTGEPLLIIHAHDIYGVVE